MEVSPEWNYEVVNAIRRVVGRKNDAAGLLPVVVTGVNVWTVVALLFRDNYWG